MTATDIETLDDLQFRRFMRELLQNEMAACGRETRFIDNPGDGNEQGQDAETNRPAGDGGSDAFIPFGRTIWQYKAERRAPSEAELKEEISKDKPKALLKAGGSYRFVAQQPRQNESDKADLLRAIAKSKRYKPEQVDFFAQASLASRARKFPSLALLPFFRRHLDSVHSFDWWMANHSSTAFDSASRERELRELLEFVRTASRPAHIHVAGPAGVGKTRLVLHAIGELALGPTTAYAPSPNAAGFSSFQKWCAEQKARLLLVVDECDEASALKLRESITAHDLSILLITINKTEDGKLASSPSHRRIHLDPMKQPDIVRILQASTKLTMPQIFAIARITGGFVKLAHVVAEAVARDHTSAYDPASLITVGRIREAVRSLLGVTDEALNWFGVVALFSEIRDTQDDTSDVPLLAEFAGVSVANARAWNAKAITGQVLSDRGERLFVTPALLAVLLGRDIFLARRQDLAAWLRRIPRRLQEAFALQLGQLRYSDEGQALARDLMSVSGPFRDLLAERQPWASEVFLALGAVARGDALTRLEQWTKSVPQAARQLSEDVYLERLLFRLIWRPEHFARTFALLLRGLAAAPEPEKSGLHRVMAGSLSVDLANSRAPYSDRFAVAARAVRDTTLPVTTRALVMRALAHGIGDGGGDGYSDEDVDVTGREYWHPTTYGELWECARSVAQLLVDHLGDDDETVRGEAARGLLDHAADFIRNGAHAILLPAIPRVLDVDPRVGTLRENLERLLAYDSVPKPIAAELRGAIDGLPQDLRTRIRVLVESWPLVSDRGDRDLPLRPDEEQVAAELVASTSRKDLVELLFQPWARNSGGLLSALASRPDASEVWPDVLVAARASGETWAAALFLAVAHDAGPAGLRGTALRLLSDASEYDIALGAEAITRSNASDEEVKSLADGVRLGRVKPESLRYAIWGRWTQSRPAGVLADLIRATHSVPTGRVMALALAFAAGDNAGISNEEQIDILVSSMFEVRGHDAWTWEQLGNRIAKQEPVALGRVLLHAIAEHARLPEHRYAHWATDEVSKVVDTCIKAAPLLAVEFLALWDSASEFVRWFGSGALVDTLDAATLAGWATDDRRQRALAEIVIAGANPKTEALLEHFGASSAFAAKLREQLHPRSWSGSLAEILKSRAAQARAWAQDRSKPHSFREWAASSAEWLSAVAKSSGDYDD